MHVCFESACKFGIAFPRPCIICAQLSSTWWRLCSPTSMLHPSSSRTQLLVCVLCGCVSACQSSAHKRTCFTESKRRYTPLKDCLAARVTCKHAEEVFLDQSVQTRVSHFIAANDLRSEVLQQVVVAVIVTMLDMPRLVCHC